MKLTSLEDRIKSSAIDTSIHARKDGYASPIVLARLYVAWLKTDMEELLNYEVVPNRENRIANLQRYIDYRLQVLAYMEGQEAA